MRRTPCDTADERRLDLKDYADWLRGLSDVLLDEIYRLADESDDETPPEEGTPSGEDEKGREEGEEADAKPADDSHRMAAALAEAEAALANLDAEASEL